MRIAVSESPATPPLLPPATIPFIWFPTPSAEHLVPNSFGRIGSSNPHLSDSDWSEWYFPFVLDPPLGPFRRFNPPHMSLQIPPLLTPSTPFPPVLTSPPHPSPFPPSPHTRWSSLPPSRQLPLALPSATLAAPPTADGLTKKMSSVKF